MVYKKALRTSQPTLHIEKAMRTWEFLAVEKYIGIVHKKGIVYLCEGAMHLSDTLKLLKITSNCLKTPISSSLQVSTLIVLVEECSCTKSCWSFTHKNKTIVFIVHHNCSRFTHLYFFLVPKTSYTTSYNPTLHVKPYPTYTPFPHINS